jgi:hypothetical protein
MNADQLTPQQKAFLNKVWRLHKNGGIPRRRKILRNISVGFAILFLVVSFFGIVNEWEQLAVWAVSFLAGYCIAVAGTTRGNIQLWPAWEAIIDWERLSAIAKGGESTKIQHTKHFSAAEEILRCAPLRSE